MRRDCGLLLAGGGCVLAFTSGLRGTLQAGLRVGAKRAHINLGEFQVQTPPHDYKQENIKNTMAFLDYLHGVDIKQPWAMMMQTYLYFRPLLLCHLFLFFGFGFGCGGWNY